jgi:hypothetical protein
MFFFFNFFLFQSALPYTQSPDVCVCIASGSTPDVGWQNSFKRVNCRIVHTNIHENDSEHQENPFTSGRTLISNATRWTASLQNGVRNILGPQNANQLQVRLLYDVCYIPKLQYNETCL